jgi:hypothetical protein
MSSKRISRLLEEKDRKLCLLGATILDTCSRYNAMSTIKSSNQRREMPNHSLFRSQLRGKEKSGLPTLNT